ncbi:MAG: TonB-dependent receptor [Bacteroidota bacterium]|nr:TonB-dependent receptor [Bacteroidota bacterium]
MNRLLLISILTASVFNQIFSQHDDSIRYQLAPITITATRIAESWIETPLAISQIDGADLNRLRGYGIDEALNGIPGVLGQSRYGNQDIRLTIRGFGARGAGERSNAGTSRGIRVLVDGFPETEPDGRTSFDLIDISSVGRIEVIRSNASSLWGNAAGGIVHITSNTAFQQPFVNINSSFGSFGFRKETFNIGAFVGSGRFYLNLSNTNFRGWRNHSSSTRALINTGIVSMLGEQTKLGVHLTATSNLFRIPGPLTAEQFNTNPQQAQEDTLKDGTTFTFRDERRFNRLGRIGINFSHDFDGEHGITSMVFINPKYLQRSERNTFRDFNRYHLGGNFIYRYGFTVNSNLKNIFLLGADEAYQDGSILFYSLDNGQRGSELKNNKREGANNFGIFVQDELLFKDYLSIAFGGRFDNVTYYSENFINQNIRGEKSFKRFTPKAGITYRFSPTHSIYANLGGGVEVPAGNETDPYLEGPDRLAAVNPLLDPIQSTTFELGTKHLIPLQNDNIVQSVVYDIALYTIIVKNDLVPYQAGKLYLSAGKTQRTGIEISLKTQLHSGLSIHSAFTYSHNEYEEYIIDSNYTDPKSPGQSFTLSGNKIAGVPDYFYKFGLNYVPKYLSYIYTEINLQGVSKYFADDVNSLNVPGYNIINAVVGFDNLKLFSDKLVLRGYIGINNITDKNYAASAYINPDVNKYGMPIYLEPGLPRNYTANLSVGWNF